MAIDLWEREAEEGLHDRVVHVKPLPRDPRACAYLVDALLDRFGVVEVLPVIEVQLAGRGCLQLPQAIGGDPGDPDLHALGLRGKNPVHIASGPDWGLLSGWLGSKQLLAH